MKEIKVRECLNANQIDSLMAPAKTAGLLDKPVNQITLGELRFIGATLRGSNFAYESDTVAVLKLLYNAITQTF